MWLNVGAIRRHIDKHAGSASEASRSLYAHFFSAKEEAGIYGRLAGLPTPPALFPRTSDSPEAPVPVFNDVELRQVA